MQRSVSKEWEHLTVEVRFFPDSKNIMFFDHYANEYRTQNSELDQYLAKLGVDGWKQVMGLGSVQDRPHVKGYIYKRRKEN